MLDHQHRSTLFRHIGGIVVAVPLGAHNADEQAVFGDLAGIIEDVGHFGVQRTLHQCVAQAFQQLFQQHRLFTSSQNIRRTRQGR